MAVKLGIISLGCPKNTIDTEVMLALLKDEYEFVPTMEEADIVIINTCAFIAEAKEETINTILEAEQQKRFHGLKGIIVTGCYPERYKERLLEKMPRVDAFLGVAAYKDIKDAINCVLKGEKYINFADLSFDETKYNRVVTTLKPTAYVKIADGCNNKCSYCVIPSIRGEYRSRKTEDITSEVEKLAKDGYSEIILVAQDTTKYGIDLYGKASLSNLIEKCAKIEGVKWLRILYMYPEDITDEILDTMLKYDNVVKYIEMPVQHFDDRILKLMNRKNSKQSIYDTVERIRSKSKDFVLRTTVIVGFPSEKREEVDEISKCLKEIKFDNLGVFAYSAQRGTTAYDMEEQIDEEEKEFRKDAIINLQSYISYEKKKDRINKDYEVLIEGKDSDTGFYYGRSREEIPEVDGKIFINAKKVLEQGKFYNVKITKAYNYDCVGELI